MTTRLLKTSRPQRDRSIAVAARLIRAGELVAFPTETVYGLGANALDAAAVRKIFKVKGRPADNPLIAHIYSVEQLWLLTERIPMMLWVLAAKFWPGPLTVLLHRSARVPDVVTAGLPTVGVRMPGHPVAQMLLEKSNVPIVAPSANLSGRPSPTTAMHVIEDLHGRIPAILDGGPCRIGLESTILDITTRVPRILRPGGIPKEELEDVLRMKLRVAASGQRRPLSPGMKYPHYAPRAEVLLFEGARPNVLKAMRRMAKLLTGQSQKVGIMAQEGSGPWPDGSTFFSMGNDGARSAAKSAFAGFRHLDNEKVDTILCQGYSEDALGAALMNRLRKAATRIIRA